MKWSLSLGKLFGIKLFVHWTFSILILWIIIANVTMGQSIGQVLMAIAFILTVFLCVTLHELGHALTAKRFNINTKNIMLLPIGGVASIEKMPENPRQEFLIAIAGPLVNVLIAAVLFVVQWITTGVVDFTGSFTGGFLSSLLSINIILAVFNLIPAFPMDGGRILRALLAMQIGRVRATRSAALIGQFIAIGFVFLGLFTNPFLVFIGLFVFLGAQYEAQQVESTSLLSAFRVKDVMMHELPVMQANDTIAKAVERLLNGQEKEFLIMDGQNIAGILGRDELIKGLSDLGDKAPLSSIMKKDFVQLTPETSMEEALSQMQKDNYSILPVTSDGKLAGTLDMENITEFIMIQAALEKQKQRQEIY
jgi:Zn-dependent protease/predicted transcriptional regulator